MGRAKWLNVCIHLSSGPCRPFWRSQKIQTFHLEWKQTGFTCSIFALAACVDGVEMGMICCEFQRLSREMLLRLQAVLSHNSFLLCILENIPKETKLDAEKIMREKKNNTLNSEQFYFNRLICLPAGHSVDYL